VQLLLEACNIARADACHFENFDLVGQGTSQRIAMKVSACGGAVIGGSTFGLEDPPQGPCVGVKASAEGNGPIVLLPNGLTRVTTLVEIEGGAADCVVMPQFDDARGDTTVPGDVAIPASPNQGLIGVPHVRRLAGDIGDLLRGLILPSGPSDPTFAIQNGMLFYNTDSAVNVVRVRVNGVWKSIKAT
jgi:hypothetical protein